MNRKPLILRRKLIPIQPTPPAPPQQVKRTLNVGDVVPFHELPIDSVFMIDVLTSGGTKLRVLKKISELMAQDVHGRTFSIEFRALCTVAVPAR